mmetsp:Transcript_3125/g.4736  ORF Transcript_3125/g.4736 Transcript_3125/m.4736 type:complete len:188 (-) Transcript_3125:48-611(-)
MPKREGDAEDTVEKRQRREGDSSSVRFLEDTYREALQAYKQDKSNKDLRRAKSAAKKAWDEAVLAMSYGAESLTCRDCSQMFLFHDRQFYEEQGWSHTPTRCQNCRNAFVSRKKDRSKLDDNGGKKMCYAFQRGECTRGKLCKFSHDPNHGGKKRQQAAPKAVCFSFRKGECKFGDACKYHHPKDNQ